LSAHHLSLESIVSYRFGQPTAQAISIETRRVQAGGPAIAIAEIYRSLQ